MDMMSTQLHIRLLDKCSACGHTALKHQNPEADGPLASCREAFCRCQHFGMKKPGRSKFGNVRIEMDGFTFDSQAEHRRYLVLKGLADEGKIRSLKVHPVFVLFPTLDRTRRGITYAPDFTYDLVQQTGWRSIAEDVKGAQTELWRLKRRCFELLFPAIELRVVPVASVGFWIGV
jgi:hypothetical protein